MKAVNCFQLEYFVDQVKGQQFQFTHISMNVKRGFCMVKCNKFGKKSTKRETELTMNSPA